MKKLLTRLLGLGMIAVLIYFATLLHQPSGIEIASAPQSDATSGQVTGENVTYQAFDETGQETAMIQSGSVAQVDENQYHLKDAVRSSFLNNGRRIEVFASEVENRPDGTKVLRSGEAGPILLRADEGVIIETMGPLIAASNNLFYTDALANFSHRGALGQCVGLRYQPEISLEMQQDAEFYVQNASGSFLLDAQSLTLNLKKNTAQVSQGNIQMTSLRPEREALVTRLDAAQMFLAFQSTNQGERYNLSNARFEGSPGRLTWNTGSLVSNSYEICFDSAGQIESLFTGAHSTFEALSEDGYRLAGQCGQLMLYFTQRGPQMLTGQGRVNLKATKPDQPDLTLEGNNGIRTAFRGGRAYGTRLFGSPTFEYRHLSGQSGSLRLLHGEGKILFGENAQLRDNLRDVQVKGDEVLLAEWDQPNQEVFANGFVEMHLKPNHPEGAFGQGDQLTLKLPGQMMTLKGTPSQPAKMEKEKYQITALQVHLEEDLSGRYNLSAEGQVSMLAPLLQGDFSLRGRKLYFTQHNRQVTVEEVSQAQIPGQGSFSCDVLKAVLTGEDQQPLERLDASGHVIFQGQFQRENQTEHFTCRSDHFTFDHQTQVIVFSSENSNVVVKSESGEQRGRQLTYFLEDGSMRVDSDAGGTTKTILPVKDRRQKPSGSR